MTDWRTYVKDERGLVVKGDTLSVTFPSGRTHVVSVTDVADCYLLSAIAARASVIGAMPDSDQRAWSINRSVDLVGFRVDDRGRFVGEAWVPKPGMTSAEFVLIARRLAAECDRVEFVLTGEDRE